MFPSVRSSFCFRHQLQRCILNEIKRSYAPRSTSNGSEDDFDLSNNRIPSRLQKRLAQQGLSVEDMQIPPEMMSAESTHHTYKSGRAPDLAVAGTNQEITELVKDVVGAGPDPILTSDDDVFPSDAQKFYDWKRDQSRKAFRPRVDPSKTTLVLFPGQGSQFVGMGKDTLDYGRSRELFEEASAILKYDLLKMCLDGPLSTLSKTVHCQPAVLVSSLAAVEKLQEQNPEAVECCVGTAGFSVGEYSALVFAGVMNFTDAVEVVRVRAEVMQWASEEVSSGMLTVFLGPAAKLKTAMSAARDYCQQRCNIASPVCTVANFLYPECKVIAGHTEALDFIQKHGRTFGIRRTKRLPVSGAFHTKLMSSALRPLRDILHRVTISPPQVPVYSNVTASPFRKPEKVAELLQKQVVSPVKWEQTMHVMYSRPQGEVFPASFEAGPGQQLGLMLKYVNHRAYEKYMHVGV